MLVVHKIPFTVLSVSVYVYLFATVPDSLSLEFWFVLAACVCLRRHRLGGIELLVLLVDSLAPR